MPKITNPISDALNDQINRELESAYVYPAMSTWADGKNLRGAAGDTPRGLLMVDRHLGERSRATPGG